MANLFALQTLIELAVTEVDEAASRLGRAVKGVDDAKQKLALLSNYRDEYVSRFQQTMTAGFTPLAYRNYQNFMDKLDTAIRGQEQILRDSERRADTERSAWRESERKRISYDALKTRAERDIEKKDAKREQKQSDEAAARKFLYKR